MFSFVIFRFFFFFFFGVFFGLTSTNNFKVYPPLPFPILSFSPFRFFHPSLTPPAPPLPFCLLSSFPSMLPINHYFPLFFSSSANAADLVSVFFFFLLRSTYTRRFSIMRERICEVVMSVLRVILCQQHQHQHQRGIKSTKLIPEGDCIGV